MRHRLRAVLQAETRSYRLADLTRWTLGKMERGGLSNTGSTLPCQPDGVRGRSERLLVFAR